MFAVDLGLLRVIVRSTLCCVVAITASCGLNSSVTPPPGLPNQPGTGSDAGTCVPKARDAGCVAQTCGSADNGCDGVINCGTCEAPKPYCNKGNCSDMPCKPLTKKAACGLNDCGTASDGCDKLISCGVCDSTETCENGRCRMKPTCTPDCAGKCNGAYDGCQGACNGTCPGGTVCQGQQCVTCVPNCAGKCNGASDGCGGGCYGTCM